MFIRYVFMSFLFWGFVALATPLQGIDGQTINSPPALNLTSTDLLSPSNASIQDPNASSVGVFDIRCDGARFGYNPSLSDCEAARGHIVPDSQPQTFGARHTGLPADTFPLPYIIMGGTLEEVEEISMYPLSNNLDGPDKAECFFQPIIIGDGPIARASLNQIRSAASALFLQCALSNPSQGGIVANIGKT